MQVAVQRRPTLLLVIVLAGLFLVMSASHQTRGVVGDTRTMFERMVMTVFSPIPRTVNRIGQSASDVYHGYIDMRRAVAENVRLRRQLAELTKENLILQRSYEDLSRVRSILSYSEQLQIPSMLTQVVMIDTAGIFKSIIVDRGSDKGIAVNDVVVNPSGVVGRVVLTTRDLSKIQLVIDANSAVGALIDRTRRQGVIRGDGEGGLQMLYVPSLSDVKRGDLIVTAGTDGIFPKGIPIARVDKVAEGSDLFKNVHCQPLVDFGSLEDVLVLHTRKIPSDVVRYAP
ncbi:MAG: rod shape-determining protein MreC [Thermoanaerobaculia bacterium]